MASSLVVITTKDVGMVRFINHEKNGLVINYGNSDELINSIKMLNNNRSLLKELSVNAHESAKKLKWDELGKMYFNHMIN